MATGVGHAGICLTSQAAR